MYIDGGHLRAVVISELTRDDIECILIHMNAFKEILCNQCRYKDAQEYQMIVDKLNRMLAAESYVDTDSIKNNCR